MCLCVPHRSWQFFESLSQLSSFEQVLTVNYAYFMYIIDYFQPKPKQNRCEFYRKHFRWIQLQKCVIEYVNMNLYLLTTHWVHAICWISIRNLINFLKMLFEIKQTNKKTHKNPTIWIQEFVHEEWSVIEKYTSQFFPT